MAARERSVLVVEDNVESADVLARILRLRGYSVKTASDGADAIAVLRDGLRPSVIVLDVWMPNMDGRQFRATQLADPDLAGIPVVVYSVDPGEEQLPQVVGHIRKGAEGPDALLSLIDSTVG